MSSDQEYMDFLNKANSDVGGSTAKSAAQGSASATSVNTEVPSSLQNVDAYFTSDADEPFEPVALEWKGDSIPSADELASLTGTKGKVTIIKRGDFDPRGEYSKIIDLVKEVGKGELAFFRVDISSTRIEYYVISVIDGKVVGLKARAVES